VTLFKFVMV